jgi:hypothetical protein
MWFERLNYYGVVINPAKCEFSISEITFIRYTVNADGINPERVEAIINDKKPVTAKQLGRYLGMINFHRCFIPEAANFLQLLNNLLRGFIKKGQHAHRVVGSNRKRFPLVETCPRRRHGDSASDTRRAGQSRGRRLRLRYGSSPAAACE